MTFDGANVTSKMDADLYHFLFSKSIGVLYGLKNSVNYSLANNTITFQDGYVSIYGRLIYIESGTNVYITPDSNKYGYVVVGVNTSTNSLSIYNKESSNAYPTLICENLSTADGLYELVLCAYTKTTTSVSITSSFKRKTIDINSVLIDTAKTEVKQSLSSSRYNITKVQDGVYSIPIDYTTLDESLIVVVIASSIVITIPGKILFEDVGSTTSVIYEYGLTKYSLYVSFSNDVLTFTCGNTSHVIAQVYSYR